MTLTEEHRAWLRPRDYLSPVALALQFMTQFKLSSEDASALMQQWFTEQKR